MVKQRAQPPPSGSSPAREKRGKGPTVTEVGEQIGQQLRAMFDDVVTEPVPERFRALLEELERKSSEEPDKT